MKGPFHKVVFYFCEVENTVWLPSIILNLIEFRQFRLSYEDTIYCLFSWNMKFSDFDILEVFLPQKEITHIWIFDPNIAQIGQ